MTAREVIKVLHEDGWYEVRQKGSHLHFKHPTKPGIVTVPIHRGDLDPVTLKSIWKQAGIENPAKNEKEDHYMKNISCFAELNKSDDGGYGIWFPDFLGCISYGSDIDEAREMAHEALELHVGSMLEDGEPLPESFAAASDLSGELYLRVTIDLEEARRVARSAVIR